MANYDYILKIGGNADALFKEVVKKFSDAEKYVSGDEIEIKFNCDDSEIQQLIEEVQRLNPTIGADVKLNFDQAEMRRQLTALNKYINKSMNAKSIAGDLQSELSESLNIKNIKGLNFKEFLKEQTGGMKSATKNLARDYIMGMYGDIDKLDFSSGNVTYSQIVKTISKFEELVAYSERAKASFAKIELPDFSAELKQLYKDSSIYIEGNKDNLVGSLTDTYKEEIKKLKETVKKLGIKSDMFPVVEVDIVPDIDPAEFSKEIQDKLAGHSVEIKVKPVVDDDFSSSVSDAIDKKAQSMSGDDHDKPNKPQNPNKPGDSVPIGVHPDFSPEEFVSDIQKQIDGKTIDVKVNGVFDDFVNNAGNNYAKVIEQWNEADKTMSSVGSVDDQKNRLGERGAFLNSETGYISNSYISDKLDEFSMRLREKIYSELNEEVDSIIHSHPQGNLAAPTPDDLESLKTWRKKSNKKINKSFIKGYSEVGVLDVSGIRDDILDIIISEYMSEIAKVDAMAPAQRLKEASGAKDWKDATNTLYKNALNKILADKGMSGAFTTVPIEEFIKQNRSKGNTEIEIDVKPNIKSDDITREIGEAIDAASGTPEVRIDKEDISSKIEDAINDAFKSSNVETVDDVRDSFVDEALDESLPNTHDKPNELKIPVVPDMTGFIEEISSVIIDPIPVPIKPDGINEFVNEIQESVMYSDKIRVRITSDPADSDSLIDKLANIKKYGKEFSDVFSSGAYGNAELLDNNQSLQKYIDLLRSLRDEDLIRIGFDVEELDNIKSIFSYIDNNMDEYRRLMNGESIIGADAIDDDLGSELLRLQNIFERIDKLDISGTLSSSLKDVTQENGSLVSLSQNLTDIIQKVDKKTEAFEIEGQTVSGIAQSESTDLAAIDGWIDVLIKDINALKESIENLPKIDIQLKNGDSADKLSIEYLAGIDQLKKIISDFDLNNLKIVTDAINSLKVEDSAGENLQQFANAFLTFKSNLNNFNQNSKEALSSINELLSKADELKNLATILSFPKTDIDNVINIPEVSEAKEASKDVSSAPVDANEIKNAADAYVYLSENANKYYSLIENRRQGKNLSDDDISFFEKYEQCFIDAANSAGVFADASEDAAQKAKEAYEKSIDSAKESAKALSMEAIRKAFDKLPLENKTPQYIEYVDDIKSKIEELESLLPIDSLTSKDEINKINRLNDEINEMLAKAPKKSPDFDLASSMSKTNLDSSISKWMRDNRKAASRFGTELEELRLKLSDSYLSPSGLDEVRKRFVEIKTEAADLNLLGKTFGEGLIARFKSLGQYLLSFASFYDVVDILRQGFQILVDINTRQTELAKVSEASNTRLQQSFENSISTAEDLKSSISDVISATADWSRSGYSIGESEMLAEASVLYKNVGDGIDIDQASASLVSTLQGFQMEASDAISIVDKFNEVANNMPIDSAGIGEALQRSAASFHTANTDLSESIALIVGSNSVLQDPTRVGEILPTIKVAITVNIQRWTRPW